MLQEAVRDERLFLRRLRRRRLGEQPGIGGLAIADPRKQARFAAVFRKQWSASSCIVSTVPRSIWGERQDNHLVLLLSEDTYERLDNMT